MKPKRKPPVRYSVAMLGEDNKISYLSVKGRASFNKPDAEKNLSFALRYLKRLKAKDAFIEPTTY